MSSYYFISDKYSEKHPNIYQQLESSSPEKRNSDVDFDLVENLQRRLKLSNLSLL